MPHDLPKSYEPGAIEARWAEYWVKERLFSVPTPRKGDTRSVFSLLLPPPNVTGRLHMGHMLNQTQMDIIMRWHRMRGDVTLWLPGTDHAGIATQMMVERQLASEGKKRSELGREEFVRAGVVLEKAVWQRDSGTDAAAGRVGGLEPRIFHHGREPFARGARSVCPAA